ncbi:MAG: hypothetical protein IPP33_13595 [Flavobacteriales bacterium]|nr:hypothetical protein [Flavobacteriales bacterium]
MQKILGVFFLTAACCGAQAQTVNGGKAEANFSGLNIANASISITPKAGVKDLGTMSFTGDGVGGTKINFDFTRLAPTKQTLKLYSGRIVVREMPISNGPSAPELDLSVKYVPVHEATISNADDDWWYLVIAAIVAWCVTTNSSTTTNYDANGNVTGSSTTESASWDCGGGGITVNINGQSFANISRMDVVAESAGALPPVSSTTFVAAGGARITSLR